MKLKEKKQKHFKQTIDTSSREIPQPARAYKPIIPPSDISRRAIANELKKIEESNRLEVETTRKKLADEVHNRRTNKGTI